MDELRNFTFTRSMAEYLAHDTGQIGVYAKEAISIFRLYPKLNQQNYLLSSVLVSRAIHALKVRDASRRHMVGDLPTLTREELVKAADRYRANLVYDHGDTLATLVAIENQIKFLEGTD